MRSTIAALSLGFMVAAAAFTSTRDARAEQEYDVNVSGDTITVTPKDPWHINKAFSWKFTVGSTKATSFQLSEKSAKLSGAPKGTGTLKGAVCSKDQCVPFEKSITIK